MTANHISPLTNSSKWDSDKCLLLPDERDDDSPLIPEEGEHESAPVITNHSDHTPADVAVNGATETCPPVVHESSHPPDSPVENPSVSHIPTEVVVQQPTPSTGPQFRDLPVVMTDSSGNQYTTELRYVNGLLMWVAVGITCFVAASFCCPWVGLFLLCIRSLKDIEHINPEDGTVVGRFDRGADVGLR